MQMIKKTLQAVVVTGSLLAATTVAPLSVSAAYATEVTEESALELVKGLGQEAVKLLASKDLSAPEKQEGFTSLIERDFDMKLIGRFVLGKNWRAATESEKSEYLELFQKYIINTYQKRIGDYSGENLNIVKAKPLNNKEFLVNSVIVRPKGPKIQLDWRVRKSKSGELKIIDIIVENVSMALTHRDEFSSVISQNGGKVEGLLQKLRDHTAATTN